MEIRQGNFISPEMRGHVKVGMTQNQVRAALGEPLLTDPFHANRWDYIYRFEQRREMVAEQRLTLYFKDDHLTRIDDALNQGSPASVAPADSVPAPSVKP
jgi:outer membrane protein assembly factor BamE